MQELPHLYEVTASARPDSNVSVRGSDLPELVSAPPAQFGGPGNQWSPEELLVASVADCFVLTFRAIAQASRLDWSELRCDTAGKLERVERVMRFTSFDVTARLTVPEGVDAEKARRLLEKAEAGCLVTNSLSATCHLRAEVVTG